MFPPSHTTRRRVLQGGAAGLALGHFGLPFHARAAEAPPLEEYRPTYLSGAAWAFVMAATARLIPSDGEGPGALEARVPVFIDLQLAGDFGAAADWYMEGPHDPAADPYLGYQSPLAPAEIYRQAIDVFDRWCQEQYGGSFAALSPEQQDEALGALEKNAAPTGAAVVHVGGGAPGDAGGVEGQPAPPMAPGAAPGGDTPPGATETGGGASGKTQPAAAQGGAGAGTPAQPAAAAAPAKEPVEAAILPPELRDFFRLLLQNTKEGYFADPMYGGNHGMQAWVYIGFPGARGSFTEWVNRPNEPYPLGPVSISGERA